MIILKAWYHVCMYLKYIVYKLIYTDRFVLGKGTTWRKGFSLMIDKSACVKIGERCFINNYCSINALGNITIGDGTIMGENVKIYDHNHKFRDKDKSLKEQGYTIGSVGIGKNCWIGSNVVILKDVTIGDNVVVAAGIVVRDSIPSNKIAIIHTKPEYEDIVMDEAENNYSIDGGC